MPTLQEVYQQVVKRHGEDSFAAKSLRDQMAAEEYRQGMSAERLFIAGAGGRPPADREQNQKTADAATSECEPE